jgi:hypothetical protein
MSVFPPHHVFKTICAMVMFIALMQKKNELDFKAIELDLMAAKLEVMRQALQHLRKVPVASPPKNER